jgi:hypothetical protein
MVWLRESPELVCFRKRGERMKLAKVFVFPLLVLSLLATAQVNATVLFDIEIEPAAEETRVYLKADEAIRDYRKVELKKNTEAGRPDRMYLDLRNVRLGGGISVKKAGTALARVRVARRDQGCRVVFDSGLDGLFNYTISEEPDGLLVTILEPSAPDTVITGIIPEPGSEVEPVIDVAPTMETIAPQPEEDGGLKLEIATSDSPDEVLKWLSMSRWQRSTLKTRAAIYPDEEITIFFLASGVASDSNGDFSLEVSFTLLDPEGKVVFNKRRYAETSGKVPANPDYIMIDPPLGIVLNGTDPLGDYKIICLIEDMNNKKIYRTSHRIRLEP